MKIAICDDDLNQLAIIKANMEQYALNHEQQLFEIECFNDPVKLLESMAKKDDYDILLLDICMPVISGTDIVKQIRIKKSNIEIVFFTTSLDYAVEAFALKAAHYIVKPFTAEQFIEALDRAVGKAGRKNSKSISIKTENGYLRFIDLSEIMYIESFGHNQTVYLKDGESIEARETLTKLFTLCEQSLVNQFISPYKGFIVNQKSIKSIEPNEIILKNDKKIPIVKRNFGAIKQQYFKFMFAKEDE